MSPKIYLTIDNCVASKRWSEPAHWMQLFADCGVYYVEASADNEIDPLYSSKSYLEDWAAAVLNDAGKTGVKVTNLYSGHGTYATLGLAHNDVRVRERIHHDWLDSMIDLASDLNAGLGFFCHAFDQAVLNDPARYDFAYQDLTERLAGLAAYAKKKGVRYVGVEQMYTPHQVPWTVAGGTDLLQKIYAKEQSNFYLTIDTGHQSGQRKFLCPDADMISAIAANIRQAGRLEGAWLGSNEAADAFCKAALNGDDDKLAAILQADRQKYPFLYAEYADGDPYYWLSTLGVFSPIVHLQQTDGKSSAHQPFNVKCNEKGIIKGEALLKALKQSFDNAAKWQNMPQPVDEICLTLEVFAGTADLPCDIINKITDSVNYWREFIPRDGMTLDELVDRIS